MTEERIELLSHLTVSRDANEIRMELGKLYVDAGEYDKAIDCYTAVSPPHNKSDSARGIFMAWEGLNQEDPFDPRMHLGFGQMFQSFGETFRSLNYIEQAEMEYKQALTLSKNDGQVKQCLFRISELKQGLSLKPEERHHVWTDLEESARNRWQPGSHNGCLVTRCRVSSDELGKLSVSIIGQSGCRQHDESALLALQGANYGDVFKYDPAQVLDFGCMSEQGRKTVIASVVLAECNLVTLSQAEQLSRQIQGVRHCINKHIGVLRL